MRRALVTGGTRGIGAAIAAALAQAGDEVVVTGTATRGRAPAGCEYAACDFSRPGSLRTFARQVAGQRFDVLVNNAGINTIGEIEGYREDDFVRIQQVNVIAPFLLCRAVVPGMRQRRFGRIVNITSIFSVVSRIGRAAYSTSKFGLFGMSRALALEVAREDVLVNCVAPGFVETDLTRKTLGARGLREVARQVPVGRLAQPREIARVVQFLISDDNTYLTGQNIVVDGGYTCA